MFEEYTICPYPGLRSFNEDESIYFKGRDKHVDEVITLLQNNKFLMVTGASGDGKSSLIFGGLIPSAKAGFFKARYNKWKIAHFRPERSPLRNLAKSLSDELAISTSETLETELSRGFSSLVDVYTNSNQFVEQSEVSKDGANLIVIADQFEEFFTNPENFFDGAPTQEAITVVNLLLETARIALAKNLPIYVILTMRSDFIGQCTSFRGLPEYIGFSQFFVPRLKRKDLQQVIEEPAQLSGISITRRLSERLIYDLEEGIDQLPILQHALNQIWHNANDGKEELDLLHYAMVGGMDPGELPDEDLPYFEKWYSALPQEKKALYAENGLQKVIDIHADMLYQTAWDYYKSNSSARLLSKAEVHRIIDVTFTCLTKIDESRAVRNRMTLNEIKNIINDERLSLEELLSVINYFREPGNTFIHPFIEDGKPETRSVSGDTVVDITHEALIRNWVRLGKLAWKEFDYLETYQDLLKQLNRWLENSKSKNFLLPIGPLMYFEKWFESVQPSVWWISRYTETPNKADKESKSQQILYDIKEFLQRSSVNLILTKTITRYGPRRILTGLTLIAVLVLSSFYFIDASKKQNEEVLKQIVIKGNSLLEERELDFIGAGDYLSILDLHESGATISALKGIKDPSTRLKMTNIAYLYPMAFDPYLNTQSKTDIKKLAKEDILTLCADSIYNELTLESISRFFTAFSFDNYFNENDDQAQVQQVLRDAVFNYVIQIIKSRKRISQGVWLQRLLDQLLTLNLTQSQLDQLITVLSPLENKNKVFDDYFPAGARVLVGRNGAISHNGGYHILASIYAAKGQPDRVEQCFDSLFKYNSNYLSTRSYTSEYNVLEYYFRYGHGDKVDGALKFLADYQQIPAYEVYKNLVIRLGKMNDNFFNFHLLYPGFVGVNIHLISYPHYRKIFQSYLAAIRTIPDPDKRNYETALAMKKQAIFLHYKQAQQKKRIDKQFYFSLLDSAMNYFDDVSTNYLDQKESFVYRYYSDGVRPVEITRSTIFKYPDHIGYGWHASRYHSPLFIEYLLEKGLYTTFYISTEELGLTNDWLSNYLEIPAEPDFRNNVPPTVQVLTNLHDELEAHPEKDGFDFNVIHILLANMEFGFGNEKQGLYYANKIDFQSVPLTATSWQYLNFTAIYNEAWRLALHMALTENDELAYKVIETYPDANHKAAVYSKIAQFIYSSDQRERGFVYLDSAFAQKKLINESLLGPFDYRFSFLRALSEVGGDKINAYAMEVLSEVGSFKKSSAIREFIAGIATEGNYYNALSALPNDLPISDELLNYSYILAEGAKQRGRHTRPEFSEFWKNWMFYNEYIVFLENF